MKCPNCEQAEAERDRLRERLSQALDREDANAWRLSLGEECAAKATEIGLLQADNTRLRAALERVRLDIPAVACDGAVAGVVTAYIGTILRATCPACHGRDLNGERRSDGSPLVCTECGR